MARMRHLAEVAAQATTELVDAIGASALPLRSAADLDPLLARIGDARCVLLGEATHGTHEFYTWRAELTRRLVVEKGFSFVVVEGDWPDCYRINRYIKAYPSAGNSAREVLHAFARWPTWMWANAEFANLVEWLKRYNQGCREERKVGVYGLDVYSLWDSLHQVIDYLSSAAPEALPAARRALDCFEPYAEDPQHYARATVYVPESCQREAVDMLREVVRAAPTYDGDGRDGHFVAEQNALVVKNAETYYRTMLLSNSESWNVRDRHMAETLDRLLEHHGPQSKAIVWAHNTHVGDARFTDMVDSGEVNLGQLARERYGERRVVLVGFSSYRGSVIAGREWDAPMEAMGVPPGQVESWEEVLHRAGSEDKLLILEPGRLPERALDWRGHRAIGVVYRAEHERYGNYVPTVLPRRYDALLFVDRTHALHPLHMRVKAGEEATYPVGM